MNNFDKDLLKIIKHYGVLKQLKYFQSEIFELNEAIIMERAPHQLSNEINDYLYIYDITEEIADVLVMLFQFKEFYKIDGKEIIKIMEQKIERQLERIESDKDE